MKQIAKKPLFYLLSVIIVAISLGIGCRKKTVKPTPDPIVYTKVLDTTANPSDIDVNKDGPIDITLLIDTQRAGSNFSSTVEIKMSGENELLTNTTYTYKPLAKKDTVGANSGIWAVDSVKNGAMASSGAQLRCITPCGRGRGCVCGTKLYNFTSIAFMPINDIYLGLRIHAGGKLYYGWLRVDLFPVANGATDVWKFAVKDFAYNSDANQPILAGQTQ